MNEMVEVVLIEDPIGLYELDSAFDFEDFLSIVYVESKLISDFPWLSFLQESNTIILKKDIFIHGLETTYQNVTSEITVTDEIGYFMMHESQRLMAPESEVSEEWNKLPESLSGLYGEKPYITTASLLPIISELRDVLQGKPVSSYLIQYLDQNTQSNIGSTSNYQPYDFIITEDLITRKLQSSVVPLFWGQKTTQDESVLTFINTGNEIVLDPHNSQQIEVQLQHRIGERILSRTLILKSDTPIKKIYLSEETTCGYEEKILESLATFNLEIKTAYNETTKFPIILYPDTLVIYRSADIGYLTSNTALLSHNNIQLQTADNIIPSEVPTLIDFTNYFKVDDQIIETEPLSDSLVYIKYSVTQ